MSDPIPPSPRVEVITSVQRRRRRATAEKVRLVEEAMQPGSSVSFVARRYGLSPSLLFTWKRRMLEGGQQAVQADEDVVGTSRVRELERRVRDLERLLGRKTMEAEILREALDAARAKNVWLAPSTSSFCEVTVSVCANVSGLGACALVKMESAGLSRWLGS